MSDQVVIAVSRETECPPARRDVVLTNDTGWAHFCWRTGRYEYLEEGVPCSCGETER